MEVSDFAEQILITTAVDVKPQSPPIIADEGPRCLGPASLEAGRPEPHRIPGIFVFNPLAEGHIAHGKGFTPVKHQALLASDLANLPQFLCGSDDIVLLAKRPSAEFLSTLQQFGFPLPEFIEFREGRVDLSGSLSQRKIGSLQPWAWGPDSVELFEPLFGRVTGEARTPVQYFNDSIAELYSKAWSAGFLRKILAHYRATSEAQGPEAEGQTRSALTVTEPWLCIGHETGVAVDTIDGALEAIDAIRRCGHHRVLAKEAHGLAGHNAIRLWEPELLAAQRQWLARAVQNGRQVVIEPWLDRELDFSIQLEMGPRDLKLCGYTGLVNDRKGQFLANWAEADCRRCLPAKVAAAFRSPADVTVCLQRLYEGIFSFLEAELHRAGFVGPVSIDAFVYRTPEGDCRLKPIVEINPRYTMGRLTLELMKRVCPGSCGLFRLVSRAQARVEGFADFSRYAASLGERLPLRFEGKPAPGILQGALALNDPRQAQVCLATFEVCPTLNLPGSFSGSETPRSH